MTFPLKHNKPVFKKKNGGELILETNLYEDSDILVVRRIMKAFHEPSCVFFLCLVKQLKDNHFSKNIV